MKKDFLSILDLDAETLAVCLNLSAELKRDRGLGRRAPSADALGGRHVALLFEKPSLRTRSTFEIAIRELGGEVISPAQDATLGGRESIADVARNLERWVAAVVIRTFAQAKLEAFAAAAARLHVVNALTNEEHPCQALADCLTLREHWNTLPGRTLAFVGDGNNVAASLAQACLMLGISVHVASPAGYDLPPDVVAAAAAVARGGATLTSFRDPHEAVRETDAVYTDVWTSMGQEAENAARRVAFAPYRVDADLMASARPGAIFMHCLPAHRGDEVTDEVIDGPASVVFDQAENRLHTQKALLQMLVAPESI
ncbi:MAG: ornithine carbamoyltransferase [Acidobacteria bacterium]|nr:ornithine carbamoyltransferase [Acidobacteriota bacterium]